VCKFKKSIYGLRQTSEKWYFKFNDTIITFRFKKNIVDRCIYIKVSGSKLIFMILYVNDILFEPIDIGLLNGQRSFSLKTLK